MEHKTTKEGSYGPISKNHVESTSTVVEECNEQKGINQISSFVTTTCFKKKNIVIEAPCSNNKENFEKQSNLGEEALKKAQILTQKSLRTLDTNHQTYFIQSSYVTERRSLEQRPKILRKQEDNDLGLDSTGGSLPFTVDSSRKPLVLRLNSHNQSNTGIKPILCGDRMPQSTKHQTQQRPSLVHQNSSALGGKNSSLNQSNSNFLTQYQQQRTSSNIPMHQLQPSKSISTNNSLLNATNNSLKNSSTFQLAQSTQRLLNNTNRTTQIQMYQTQASSQVKPRNTAFFLNKQGEQGSQTGNSTNNDSQVQIDQVKVGHSVPKTTTSAQNLRSINNLKQFNQLFNQKIANQTISKPQNLRPSLAQPVKTFQRRSSKDKLSNSPSSSHNQSISDKSLNQSQSALYLNDSSLSTLPKSQQQFSSFGIGYRTHLKNKGISTLQKSSSGHTLLSQQRQQSSNEKNEQSKCKPLQIAIPLSPPKNNQSEIKNSEEEHSASMNESHIVKKKTEERSLTTQPCQSTKNSDNHHHNITVNKITPSSTRHDTSKANIFGDQKNKKELQQQQKSSSQEPIKRDQSLGKSQKDLPLQPAHKIIIPNHEPTKHSLKRNGLVRAYAANTNQGLVRNYNEDRVSIILNIIKPANKQHIPDQQWPRCSFFAIYDGHGGSNCADFLRDNLHQYVIQENAFPNDPKEALRSGFSLAEKNFLEKAVSKSQDGQVNLIDKSGSCAIVVLIVEEMCYIANVGDSRAILSWQFFFHNLNSEEGKKIFPLSRDHKPSDEQEKKRIAEAGGQIYHRTALPNGIDHKKDMKDLIVGPLRVLPGRLSVSRTFGDVEAKHPKLGGNPQVVVATPEITTFKLSSTNHDFLVLGCDGIFDKMSNEDTVSCVWNSVRDNKDLRAANNIHKLTGMGVEYILKNSLLRRTLDNVTVVMIAFNNFKRAVFGESKQSARLRIQATTIKIEDEKMNAEGQKKENVPPQSIKGFHSTNGPVKPSHKLKIETNQNANIQGPKSTSNACLQQLNNQLPLKQSSSIGGRKASGSYVKQPLSTIGRDKTNLVGSVPKHFDFSQV